MSESTVVMVGTLRPELVARLEQDYGARELAALSAGEAARSRVAVTSGVWGVRTEHLDRLPALEAVVNFGVGYDATDVDEAARRGVVVSNTPDVLTDCVADAAVGLVIDVMRGLSAADRFVRRGLWESGSTPPLARRVSGSRVGIVGLGRIGLAIARRLEGFGTTISYHNRRARTDVSYAYAPDVESLARGCDVLVLAAAGGDASRHLVDATVLDALGPRGFLVNVARGSVVDEAALVAALEEGRIAGAGLDVFASEPHVPSALLGRDDVVLLPHIGSATVETRQAMADLVLANVASYLDEGRLLTPVG
ncbi:lactate dehydrogenase-like 2-hydroxyacid dehydrogenase [Nocardioides sp. BE266]|uniref:2-hydroxyacid dehydrogenase n=1 Tax=Nocardioides sp. BE266 TaxID=2817725 RepID=UPI002863D330|nr:2-hydroxyacid dehydrogenase [Nocardioides sp. BE266]MDR7251935.1 lactate dehydrogenase-like 2-hydroxyacid dehydrogenase [Nocardioides sp. BE266]